jgi:hypothetical protein
MIMNELVAELHEVEDKIALRLRALSISSKQKVDLETLLGPVQAFLREYDPDEMRPSTAAVGGRA